VARKKSKTRKKSKIGRPPRHEGVRLSKMRTFRIRPELDGLLQAAASKAGRSVSEEIEYRLDRSFYGDALVDRLINSMQPLSNGAAGVAARIVMDLQDQGYPTSPELAEWVADRLVGHVRELIAVHSLPAASSRPKTEPEKK
jgi:hypothetical protein